VAPRVQPHGSEEPPPRRDGGALGAAETLANTVVFSVLALPLTLVAAVVYIFWSLLELKGRPERFLERFWSRCLLLFAGVRVRIRGAERLRHGRSYVIMANHQSWFDIPALWWALGNRDVRWIAKKELVPVPFFGWAVAASRHIVIDRQNRDKAVRAIRRATEMSGDGVSIIIFPEGTRSSSGALLPFKKGGFHLAVDAGLEILPVAIRGTRKVLPKHGWGIRPGRVDVAFCEPVPAGEYGKANLPSLVERVRGVLQEALVSGAAEGEPSSRPEGADVT
jgi:1-acyl-sn-glycerol-3-phosphate acyltransferase